MSPLYPKNGVIYYYSGTHKTSAVLIGDTFILTSGLILLQAPFIERKFKNTSKQKIIHVDADHEFSFLQNLDYRLMVQGENGQLLEIKAQIAYMIYSSDIESTIEQKFKNLSFSLDGEYKAVSEYSIYFSTFLILKFPKRKLSLDTITSALAKNSRNLTVLEDIVSISTPFGNEHFINSVNFGHVANLIGKDDCLALLNISTAFGCEGGGIYDKNLNLRSILLSSCFHYLNDNVCLPLAANISEIMKILHDKPSMTLIMPNEQRLFVFRSSCMIDSMGCWGTGCLFQLNGRNFVLTCAHVLRSNNITCYCNDYSFQPKVIYKNPIFDYAYDIALLEGTKSSHNLAKLANYTPKVGQTVYSVGFPIFKEFGLNGKFVPSIYKGRVTKYSKGILNTDCPVQAGQSGGPIFDGDGSLLAVMVSNFKNDMDGIIYPNHNMCIPICDIYDILLRYSETNDHRVLTSLQAEKSIVDKWKLKALKVKCKL